MMPYNNKPFYNGRPQFNGNQNGMRNRNQIYPFYIGPKRNNNYRGNHRFLNQYNNQERRPPLPANNLLHQRQNLPIYPVKKKILEYVEKHCTLILIGETGSGKTTQLPQFLREDGFEGDGKIAITQPRRVAAMTIAKRVSEEVGTELGAVIGYSVRFEDVTSDKTKIKFLTDGMLLREAMLDPLLKQYTVVILDEAHERTIHTDVLFGIVKVAQERRKDTAKQLKIIVMSATMDMDHFSKYFGNCPVLYLEGRQFAVDHFYASESQEDFAHCALVTLFQVHRDLPADHHVLIFLTGQEEIESMVHTIQDISRDEYFSEFLPMRVFPLYASLPAAAQLLALAPVPAGTRKVVISTNIAETSITVEGMKVVIDGGMVKAKSYQAGTGLEVLKVQRISQAQSWQRAGRVGRQSEGLCYKAYTRKEFDSMLKHTVPEIQRCNLSSMVLQLLAIGIENPVEFDYLDSPPKESLASAIKLLEMLGAVTGRVKCALTGLGKMMSLFPLAPAFSKVILASKEYSCTAEVLTIISMLSGDSPLSTPPTKREEALKARNKFISTHGDHVTLLKIYRDFRASKQSKEWCMDNYIHFRHMSYAVEVRKQLSELCHRCCIPLVSCGENYDKVRKCLLSGLFTNVAVRQTTGQYTTLETHQKVWIHPSSVLFMERPSYVIFTELIQTGKSYIRDLSLIDPDWIAEVAPEYYQLKRIGLTAKTNA